MVEDKDDKVESEVEKVNNHLTSMLLLGSLSPVVEEVLVQAAMISQARQRFENSLRHFPAKPRLPLKQLVTVGTTFNKGGRSYRITRVTDLVFDAIDTLSGEIRIRSLGLWERESFMRDISLVRGLLSMSNPRDRERGRGVRI